MQALVERIRTQGRNLGNGILKVDGFINHQLDPELTMEMCTLRYLLEFQDPDEKRFPLYHRKP